VDFHAAKTYLSSAIESFNNKPLDVLSAYTPLEVLHGAIPDKNRFKASNQNSCTGKKNCQQTTSMLCFVDALLNSITCLLYLFSELLFICLFKFYRILSLKLI